MASISPFAIGVVLAPAILAVAAAAPAEASRKAEVLQRLTGDRTIDDRGPAPERSDPSGRLLGDGDPGKSFGSPFDGDPVSKSRPWAVDDGETTPAGAPMQPLNGNLEID